ncbi:MAG: SGNH/GDSL hydrolase family protein [Ruminococcaceae bacterium]|nr:SGNH/GDSL hydrolase family protein [Oscillospiraceae bacterium]
MKQIFIFGDSIVKGVTYSTEADKYRLVPDRYATLASRGWEIKNCALMGATVEEGTKMLQKKLVDTSEDTTVLLEFGGNDCDYHWADISADPTAAHQPKTPLEHFTRLYGELVSCAREKGASVYICNLVPLDSDKYMNWISRGLNYDSILGWLGDSSMLYRWHEFYSRTTEKLAEKLDCPLIDLRQPFLMSHHYRNLLSDDGIHPTAEGHALIDRTIAAALA